MLSSGAHISAKWISYLSHILPHVSTQIQDILNTSHCVINCSICNHSCKLWTWECNASLETGGSCLRSQIVHEYTAVHMTRVCKGTMSLLLCIALNLNKLPSPCSKFNCFYTPSMLYCYSLLSRGTILYMVQSWLSRGLYYIRIIVQSWLSWGTILCKYHQNHQLQFWSKPQNHDFVVADAPTTKPLGTW